MSARPCNSHHSRPNRAQRPHTRSEVEARTKPKHSPAFSVIRSEAPQLGVLPSASIPGISSWGTFEPRPHQGRPSNGQGRPSSSSGGGRTKPPASVGRFPIEASFVRHCNSWSISPGAGRLPSGGLTSGAGFSVHGATGASSRGRRSPRGPERRARGSGAGVRSSAPGKEGAKAGGRTRRRSSYSSTPSLSNAGRCKWRHAFHSRVLAWRQKTKKHLARDG